MRRILILFVLPLAAATAKEAREITIGTPRGAQLQATLHMPDHPNGAAFVLAPGKGYHRGLPLMVTCAERLAEAGFVAIRFDWAYFTAKKAPAPDLSTEIEDLDAAIAYAGGLEGIRKVLVAGKSLGSVAAVLRAERKSDDLAGIALLTLPIHWPGEAGKIVPEAEKIAKFRLPMLVLCGDNDDMCRPGSLYGLAASCAAPPTIVIVPGDHGLAEGDDAAKKEENVALAAHAVAVWAKRRVQ